MPVEPNTAGWDPATDPARSASRLRIQNVYEALLEDGFEDEAQRLREAGTRDQHNLALEYANGILNTDERTGSPLRW
jgi:hypothetical protein